jgi:glucose-1-phosphate adenylyltransferase
LSLAGTSPPFALASGDAPVYTRTRFLPPSLVEGATVKGSLIADGCRIGRGAVIENSIIGLRCLIGENVTIRDSIIMGSDAYESGAERQLNRRLGRPTVGIGANTVIQSAIVDKNCRIGNGVRIANDEKIQDSPDADDCIIRDGIPVVVKQAILPDGWRLEPSLQTAGQAGH